MYALLTTHYSVHGSLNNQGISPHQNPLLINERKNSALAKKKKKIHICFMFFYFYQTWFFARTASKPKALLILKGWREPSQTNGSVAFLINATFSWLPLAAASAAISSVSHRLLAGKQPEQVFIWWKIYSKMIGWHEVLTSSATTSCCTKQSILPLSKHVFIVADATSSSLSFIIFTCLEKPYCYFRSCTLLQLINSLWMLEWFDHFYNC